MIVLLLVIPEATELLNDADLAVRYAKVAGIGVKEATD